MPNSEEGQSQFGFLERLEKYGYITAGMSFLVLGMIVFFEGWIQFFRKVGEALPHAVLGLMDGLLLVVIFLELFRTSINFLRRRRVSLDPFLHVGIIASIRRLLSIGAEMTIEKNIPSETFNQFMVDAGVHTVIILVLIIAMYIYRSRVNFAEAQNG